MHTTPNLLAEPRETSLPNSFYYNELPILIGKIKNDCGWKAGDLKSMVIINEPQRQVILTALHSQTEIESRQTGEYAIFQVLEGNLKLNIRKESTTLTSGQKFTLYDKTKYNLEALSECIFLLIIGPAQS